MFLKKETLGNIGMQLKASPCKSWRCSCQATDVLN